jgi:hypothetical protein
MVTGSIPEKGADLFCYELFKGVTLRYENHIPDLRGSPQVQY